MISPDIQTKLLPFKILSILFSLFSIGFIVFSFKKTKWLTFPFEKEWVEFSSMKAYEAVGFVKKWSKVKKRLEKEWESEAKLAVIEADKLLDEVLRRMGYKGASLGERLKQLDKNILPNIEEVWRVHQVRNDIVHDPNYRLTVNRAGSILEVYEQAFKSLEAI